MYDVIIIGSGLGGLSAGSRLAKLGYKVLILEKHCLAGGYATNFKRKDYTFDVSLHGIGGLCETGNLYKILLACDVIDKIKPLKSSLAYSINFKGKKIDIPNNYEAYKSLLISLFPNYEKSILNLFKALDKFENGFKKFILEKDEGFFNKLSLDVALFIKWSSKTTYQVIKKYVDNEDFIRIFTSLWTYYGLPPKELSALYYFIPWLSYHKHGKYYIQGGGQALSNAFVSTIKENSGDILLKSEVVKIKCESKLVKSVKIKNGNTFQAKHIIANLNPNNVLNLMDKVLLSEFDINRAHTDIVGCTLSELYLGLDCNPSDINIPNDEIFYFEGSSHEEDYKMALKNEYEKSGFLLTNYNSMDKKLNDTNKGVITITYIDNYDFWSADKEIYKNQKLEVTEKIIKRLEKYYPKIREHIVISELGTPRTMERYTKNPRGAVYGFSQYVKQAGRYRFPKETNIKNFSFVGAWTNPGGGYEGVISGGIVEAHRIDKLLKNEHK
ncbi:MAG: phytoene desaturase family protein [Sarcina sp.]